MKPELEPRRTSRRVLLKEAGAALGGGAIGLGLVRMARGQEAVVTGTTTNTYETAEGLTLVETTYIDPATGVELITTNILGETRIWQFADGDFRRNFLQRSLESSIGRLVVFPYNNLESHTGPAEERAGYISACQGKIDRFTNRDQWKTLGCDDDQVYFASKLALLDPLNNSVLKSPLPGQKNTGILYYMYGNPTVEPDPSIFEQITRTANRHISTLLIASKWGGGVIHGGSENPNMSLPEASALRVELTYMDDQPLRMIVTPQILAQTP